MIIDDVIRDPWWHYININDVSLPSKTRTRTTWSSMREGTSTREGISTSSTFVFSNNFLEYLPYIILFILLVCAFITFSYILVINLNKNSKGTLPAKILDTRAYGKIYITPEGLPLYTYDKDESNESNCTAIKDQNVGTPEETSCQDRWPLFTTNEENPKYRDGFGVIKTLNDKNQYVNHITLHRQPLYTFFKDVPFTGEAQGNDINDWHIVKYLP